MMADELREISEMSFEEALEELEAIVRALEAVKANWKKQ